MNLIRVLDGESQHEYDLLFVVPDDLDPHVARQIVERAVVKVKGDNPDGYVFDDLQEELRSRGFDPVVPEEFVAREEW